MAALLGAILAIFVVSVLLYPLVKRPRIKPASAAKPQEARSTRRAIYREIANLRNDFESGHITQAEFDQQMHSLRIAAAFSLRDEDEARAEAIASELQIEAEVQRLRQHAKESDEASK